MLKKPILKKALGRNTRVLVSSGFIYWALGLKYFFCFVSFFTFLFILNQSFLSSTLWTFWTR